MGSSLIRFRGIVEWVDAYDASVPGDWGVKILEVFEGGDHYTLPGESVHVHYRPFGGPIRIDVVNVGDEVEVYGEYYHDERDVNHVYLNDSSHYLRRFGVVPNIKFIASVIDAPAPTDIIAIVDEVLDDPTGKLKQGDKVYVDAYGYYEANSKVDWPLQSGDRIEVYGSARATATWISVGPLPHYLTKLSARPNQPPIAVIDVIVSESGVFNRAKKGEIVSFRGHGEDQDGDSIVAWSWRSSRDGVLSNDAWFDISSLNVGKHIIYFKVKDSRGAWSEEAVAELTIVDESTRVVNLEIVNAVVDSTVGDIGGKVTIHVTFSNTGLDEIPKGSIYEIYLRFVDKGDRDNLLNFDSIRALRDGEWEIYSTEPVSFEFDHGLRPGYPMFKDFTFDIPSYDIFQTAPVVFTDTLRIIVQSKDLHDDAEYDIGYRVMSSYDELFSALTSSAFSLLRVELSSKIANREFREYLLKKANLLEEYIGIQQEIVSLCQAASQRDMKAVVDSACKICLHISNIVGENPISLVYSFVEGAIVTGRVVGNALTQFLNYVITTLEKIIGTKILSVSIWSPVDFIITTEHGQQRVGYRNGSIYKEIENSSVIFIGDHKIALLPEKDVILINLFGTGNGKFSMTINTANRMAQFPDIDVSSITKVNVIANIAQNDYLMKKNTDGDGTYDEEIRPILYRIEDEKIETIGTQSPKVLDTAGQIYTIVGVISALVIITIGVVLLQRSRRVRVYGLSLTVVGPDGLPVSSAKVFLDGVYRGETDTKGGLRMSGVPPGTYSIAVEVPGFEKALTSVSIPSQKALTIFLKKEEYRPPPPPPPPDGEKLRKKEQVQWLEETPLPEEKNEEPGKPVEEEKKETGENIEWL
jgi:hypothetical protein